MPLASFSVRSFNTRASVFTKKGTARNSVFPLCIKTTSFRLQCKHWVSGGVAMSSCVCKRAILVLSETLAGSHNQPTSLCNPPISTHLCVLYLTPTWIASSTSCQVSPLPVVTKGALGRKYFFTRMCAFLSTSAKLGPTGKSSH